MKITEDIEAFSEVEHRHDISVASLQYARYQIYPIRYNA